MTTDYTQFDDSNQAIVVIGAGIVGVSTAIWLQRAGKQVTLIDRSGPAAGTSYGNAGILASASIVPVTVPGLIGKAPKMLLHRNQPLFLNWSYLPRMLPWLARYLSHCNPDEVRRIAAALTPILANSLHDHRALAAGTGAERFITADDYMYLYNDREHFNSDAFGWQVRAENGFSWQELEGTALQRYDPVFSDRLGFGAPVGNHGRISDPGAYVTQLATHFEQNGGRLICAEAEAFIYEQSCVRGIRAGGTNHYAQATVLALGAWSGALMKQVGYKIPMESERGYHIELLEPNVTPRTPTMIASGKFVMTPMDGRLRLAGMVEFGGLVADANRSPIEFLKRHIHQVIPTLKWQETREWLGHRPAPSDSIPLIGEVPQAKNLFVGFGHQHVGLTGGARTGQLLAQLICTGQTDIDLSPYRPDRF